MATVILCENGLAVMKDFDEPIKAFERWLKEITLGKKARLFINDEDVSEGAYVLVAEALIDYGY